MKGKLILSVENEKDIQQLVSNTLKKAGCRLIYAESGEECLEKLGSEKPDLIILDLMLPGINGMEVCKHIKKIDYLKNIPVVLLAAKGDESDVIAGLDMGAEDFITKPFNPNVLLARIKTVLRHRAHQTIHNGDDGENRIISHGALVIDLSRFDTKINGKPVQLTLTEFSILKILARRAGEVFSREQIIDSVRGYECSVTPRAVDVHIFSLRNKLGALGKKIESVHGVGYRFKDDG